jgi:hypothetical protein
MPLCLRYVDLLLPSLILRSFSGSSGSRLDRGLRRGTVESNHIGVRSCDGRVDTATGRVESDFIRVVAVAFVAA